MSEKDVLRVGVIGCGAGMFHLRGYAEDPRVKTVALAGLDTERCQRLAREYEIPRVYTDYQALLADADIDAVSIVVPNHLHLPVAKAAFEAGKHVLVEKPIANTVENGKAMIAEAEKHGLILAVAMQNRYRHDVQIVREQVESGAMGDIYYAKVHWMRRNGIPGWGSWFTAKESAGGGPLIDLGVHVLDMALYSIGNPQVVTVSASTYDRIGSQGKGGSNRGMSKGRTGGSRTFEVEDLATAFLRTDTGVTLTLEVAWASHSQVTDEYGIQLYGSDGGARIHIKDYAREDTLELYSEVSGVPADIRPRIEPRFGHSYVIRNFVSAILDGEPVSPSGMEGLDRIWILDAIYRSAELGREITVDENAELRYPAAD